jgi:hypothetical protein
MNPREATGKSSLATKQDSLSSCWISLQYLPSINIRWSNLLQCKAETFGYLSASIYKPMIECHEINWISRCYFIELYISAIIH